MSYSIQKIEGIGATYKKKLLKVGIKTTRALLERAAKKKGRKELASEAGIDETLILKWTNMADLMRVKGVGEEYSELLEIAGVDTVKELRKRKPENLYKALEEANSKGKKQLVRQLPVITQVQRWVASAKELDPVITY
ncbi:MAG: DUF4332 domain-containing protein [Pseudomonadota bacterium]